MYRGTEFIMVRDPDGKLQAMCFLVTSDNEFTAFDRYYHFMFKLARISNR